MKSETDLEVHPPEEEAVIPSGMSLASAWACVRGVPLRGSTTMADAAVNKTARTAAENYLHRSAQMTEQLKAGYLPSFLKRGLE